MTLSEGTNEKDSLFGGLENSENFTVSSAYQVSLPTQNVVGDEAWKNNMEIKDSKQNDILLMAGKT